MPVPRVVPLSLALLLALLPGNTVAAPSVAGIIDGTGTASTFTIRGAGQALEGGSEQWYLVCGECDVRVVLLTTDITVLQLNHQVFLNPGSYEIRDFRGLISFTKVAPREWAIELHGYGAIGAL